MHPGAIGCWWPRSGCRSSLGCLVAASRTSGSIRASLLAIVVGILGGVLAVLTKEFVGALRHGGIELALSTWPLYALVVVGAAGIYVQQLAFQAGALQASLPVITVLEPLVAAALGLTLLHEQLRASGGRLALLIRRRGRDDDRDDHAGPRPGSRRRGRSDDSNLTSNDVAMTS